MQITLLNNHGKRHNKISSHFLDIAVFIMHSLKPHILKPHPVFLTATTYYKQPNDKLSWEIPELDLERNQEQDLVIVSDNLWKQERARFFAGQAR